MRQRYLVLAAAALIVIVLGALSSWSNARESPVHTPVAAAAPAASGGATAMAGARSGAATTPSSRALSDAQAAARRSRFGVGLVDGSPDQVRALGLEWFTPTFQPDYDPPPGTSMPRFLPINPPLGEAEARALVSKHRGSYWLVGNEPNVPDMTYGGTDPDTYARSLNFYHRVLRDEDPTAKLVGPNVLNWRDTCNGCPGFPAGMGWTLRMRATYLKLFQAEPPLDVWSLHTYELDWHKLPMGNAAKHIAQIQGMRDWLDSIPALSGAPMWLTEIGIHWGYPGMEFRGDLAYPTGQFDTAHVERWMRELFGWLNDNADQLNIERWFLFPLSTTIFEAYQSQWAGVTLMDGPQTNAPITYLGRVYQELAGVP